MLIVSMPLRTLTQRIAAQKLLQYLFTIRTYFYIVLYSWCTHVGDHYSSVYIYQ
jgi:hypothetical protein